MTETKKWWQSKTIWGILIAFLGVAFRAFGIDTPELPANADAEQIQVYADAVKAANGSWEAIASVVLSAFGFLWGLYGRVVAETKVTS